MGNTFLTMSENPHKIGGKVNKFDKVKTNLKSFQMAKLPQNHM